MPPADSLDRKFSALSDSTRRTILQRLARGSATVKELAQPFAVSPPAISRHLRVLESAGLISQEREGQFRRCRLERDGLQSAAEWIDFHRQFWSESFDRLDAHLKATAETKGHRHGNRRTRSKP